MWFLQTRCGLLFTIINHNHILTHYTSFGDQQHKAPPRGAVRVYMSSVFHYIESKCGLRAHPPQMVSLTADLLK